MAVLVLIPRPFDHQVFEVLYLVISHLAIFVRRLAVFAVFVRGVCVYKVRGRTGVRLATPRAISTVRCIRIYLDHSYLDRS
jgi:hypothetical protein